MFKNFLFKLKNVFTMLNSQERLFENIFMYHPIPMTLTNSDGVIQRVNYAFSDFTGYSTSELIESNMSLLSSSKNGYGFFEAFWHTLHDNKKFNGHVWNQHKDGRNYLHHVNISRMDMGQSYYLSAHIDKTEEMKLKEQEQYIAHHDSLTGLVNRYWMEERLTHALLNATRNGESVGILFCDLNEFKQINDDFGHAIGDEVLQKIAKIIKGFCRESDTIARWGGDEFLILVEHLDTKSALIEMANQLSQRITTPITQHQLSISVSIGVASFPSDGLTKEQLIELSDTKMYQNKHKFYGLN